MNPTSQDPKPKKSHSFFVEELLDTTNLVEDLINIIAAYLIPATKIKYSLYASYFDCLYQFDVIIKDQQFYILPAVPRNYCAVVANKDEKLTAAYSEAYQKILHSDWLRFINNFTDNFYIFANKMRLIELQYFSKKTFRPTQRFNLLLDSIINTASSYCTIPGLMYLQLLLDAKITGYFRERDLVKTAWSAAECSDIERFFAWISDEETINRNQVLQNKKMEQDPNCSLLTNNIRINIFLTAVVIKIFNIDTIVTEQNGAKKREYDRYGFEIIKPLIHSFKHNLFKNEYEIDYILYIQVLQEQIEKYYTAAWRKKAQQEFSEFYKEMAVLESLLKLGMELFPVNSNNIKCKLAADLTNVSQPDIRQSTVSSASSSNASLGIFHNVASRIASIPQQPSDEDDKKSVITRTNGMQ